LIVPRSDLAVEDLVGDLGQGGADGAGGDGVEGGAGGVDLGLGGAAGLGQGGRTAQQVEVFGDGARVRTVGATK